MRCVHVAPRRESRAELRMIVRVIILVALLASQPSCWPGKCGGAIRAVNPQERVLAPTVQFWLNMDTNAKDGAAMLAASGISAQTILLEGPDGAALPVTVQGSIATSAHSCASAGSISIAPVGSLAAGEYLLAVFLDMIKWPAIDDDGVENFRGHRAIIRRFVVK